MPGLTPSRTEVYGCEYRGECWWVRPRCAANARSRQAISTTLNVYSDFFDHDLDDLADRLTRARSQHGGANLQTIAPVEVLSARALIA